MQELLEKYAHAFSNQLEQNSLSQHEQRSVRHPVVFLILGDSVKESLSTIIQINEEKWHNSPGVLYVHAYQTETVTHQNVFSFQLPKPEFDRKELRKHLYDTFHHDDNFLIELNKTYRRLTTKIAENGKYFSSLQKVHLCVVTAIDDPANILIQEFTLLLRSLLQESFKTIEVDLYGLLSEKQEDDQFAFAASMGFSFLRELDRYQRDDYTFEQELQLIDHHLRLPVSHSAPLFDLVYFLSDKNENGLISSDAPRQNVEMISYLNLLKNRKMITDYHEKMDSYIHQDFKRASRGNSLEPVYASAGFARVNRPNKAIALNAASHFFTEYLKNISETADTVPLEKRLELFELSQGDFERYFTKFLPSAAKIKEMNGLLTVTNSYQFVKKMTVREAEDYLFEGGTTLFFVANFADPVREHVLNLDLRSKIEHCLYEKIINNEQYGLYCGYGWTADTGESVMAEIHKQLRDTKHELHEAEIRLDQLYRQTVDQCEFKKSYRPFSDKKNLQLYLDYFFEHVYGTKLEVLKLEVKQGILHQYQQILEERHQKLSLKVDTMHQLSSLLKQTAAESLHEDSDDYLDKNIAEYYADVIREITNKLKEKYGPHFFSSERFFGNIYHLLKKPNALLERLLTVCNREVLSREEFHRSFEDELLERSNVHTQYDNQDVLSKEELFKQLYNRLNDNAAIHIEVFQTFLEHRYEERYFIGDFYSKFMHYALEKEQDTRHFKVGCAHEKKSSGIEKLSLMGGFRLKDLTYYRKAERYYNALIKDGYELHAGERSPAREV
ncbi:hypothetical protein [Bacillus sp. JJ1764]|uniref:hypothetical protein n=1 Tax=Bacillus sp. JJ1764 TaxID=3122964 RepID=UPI003000BD0F